MSLEGQIADAVIAAAEANKPAIVAAIQAAEGGVEAFIGKAVDNVKPSGALALVWEVLKPSVKAELVALEAQVPGAVIFNVLDSEAHALAKSLGG